MVLPNSSNPDFGQIWSFIPLSVQCTSLLLVMKAGNILQPERTMYILGLIRKSSYTDFL